MPLLCFFGEIPIDLGRGAAKVCRALDLEDPCAFLFARKGAGGCPEHTTQEGAPQSPHIVEELCIPMASAAGYGATTLSELLGILSGLTLKTTVLRIEHRVSKCFCTDDQDSITLLVGDLTDGFSIACLVTLVRALSETPSQCRGVVLLSTVDVRRGEGVRAYAGLHQILGACGQLPEASGGGTPVREVVPVYFLSRSRDVHSNVREEEPMTNALLGMAVDLACRRGRDGQPPAVMEMACMPAGSPWDPSRGTQR